MEELLDFAAGQAAGKTDATRDAELDSQLLQVREQRTFANDGRVGIDGLHGADQNIVPLVANEAAKCHDVAGLPPASRRPTAPPLFGQSWAPSESRATRRNSTL